MGLVSLHPTDGGFTLSYDGVSNFGDIKLAQQSLSYVSGASAGAIQREKLSQLQNLTCK